MAEWKKNSAVGLSAGIVALICLALAINFIIQRVKGSRVILSEEEKAKQTEGVKKFISPSPPAQ